MNNVYLVRDEDDSYYAVVSDIVPNGGIYLVNEGKYPTDIIFRRLDMNSDLIWDSIKVNSQNELIESINAIGSSGWAIYRLWNFDIYRDETDELGALFDRSYAKAAKEIRDAMDDMLDI